MAKAITREMAEMAMRAKAAAEAGNKEQALEATSALEVAFAGVVGRAPSDERMAILGMCYATYELLGEWEMAALKIEDAICYAEKHHRNSPETAADYAHLAEAYTRLGDSPAAVVAFEIAIEQMRQTSQWITFGTHYEKRLQEVKQRLLSAKQDSTGAASPTRRNPRLLRCRSDQDSGKLPDLKAAVDALNEEGFPRKFPHFDPIYLVVWQLERLPTAQEATSIALGFVNSGDLPAPTEKTRLARMSYTKDWANPNALSFNIAVHKLLKNSFPELARYIIVSDTGFKRDDRVNFSVVTGIGQMSGNQSGQMQFRVVEVRPGSSA
ncbi:MAG: hypothetical protein FJ222_08840 [Lentisphaerae bacterium]|nr:hypothetical protein [Lentisphaerota bacterium]